MKNYFYFLKQYKMAGSNEKELVSNEAEGVSPRQNGIAGEINNKQEALEKVFKEDINRGLIRALQNLGVNPIDFFKDRGYYNGDTEKIEEAVKALYKLPEKMTINSQFLTSDLSKKVQEALKAQEATKGDPHLYRVWEYQMRGNAIYIDSKNKDGSYSINGFKVPRLGKGDYLVTKSTVGGKYYRAIITDIEYPGNPRDYFEGNMVVVNVCNEDGCDID